MTSVTNQTYNEHQYIDGKQRSIETDRYGKTFYVDDKGKRVYINLEELRASSIMNTEYAEVYQSCEEQKQFHKGWHDKFLELADLATKEYKAGIEKFQLTTRVYNQFLREQGCEYSELQGAKKEEADNHLTNISNARSQRNRGCSDSIFYGRLANNEANSMQDYSNLQALINKMSQLG